MCFLNAQVMCGNLEKTPQNISIILRMGCWKCIDFFPLLFWFCFVSGLGWKMRMKGKSICSTSNSNIANSLVAYIHFYFISHWMFPWYDWYDTLHFFSHRVVLVMWSTTTFSICICSLSSYTFDFSGPPKVRVS